MADIPICRYIWAADIPTFAVIGTTERKAKMATYTVERFSIGEPGGLRSRHATLAEAKSAFDAACKWYAARDGVSWVNLVSKSKARQIRYLRHWERMPAKASADV
jgi:hypothetical protein